MNNPFARLIQEYSELIEQSALSNPPIDKELYASYLQLTAKLIEDSPTMPIQDMAMRLGVALDHALSE